MAHDVTNLEFRILGPLEVRDGGRRLGVDRPRDRALLAALLLRAGEVVSIDRLVDDLWGEQPPRTARAALHNGISALRRLLGPDVLLTRPPGYVLAVPREQIDVRRFERLLEQASAAAPADRADRLREALALWRGPALDDVSFEAFAQAEIARLEELRAAAREELVEAELARGRHAAVVPELEALVTEHPFRERPRAQLMIALYRSGRQAEALEAYQSARRFLDEELGLEPGPTLQKLQQAVLRQNPELDAPAHEPRAEALGEERRKTVTVLFADVVHSTALAAELDPEAYRGVLQRYFRAARAALARHGGRVEKFIGDAVFAVFGMPTSHEDDALRAVRAAAELREEIAGLNAELAQAYGLEFRLRIGVNTGEAVVGGDAGQWFVTGYAVNVAAKLQHTASPDEILLGASTYGLVREAVRAEPLAPIVLGEGAALIPAFRFAELLPDAEPIPRRLEAPLVGRQDELAELRRTFDEAREDRACRVVTVLGDAGIGKTRLAKELVRVLGEQAKVLVGRCVSYGAGATYLPVAEIVRALAPDASEAAIAALLEDEADARVVARTVRELTGMAEGAAPAQGQEGFWAVRRLLEVVARRQPIVLVLEDVHWAEPTLLDLVEYLGAQDVGAPILVVCLARPDLCDARPEWPVDITLSPLNESESAELVANLPAGDEVAGATRGGIVVLAAGNALFAEQLLAHVADVGEEKLADVPPSLEALLSARLDRLPEDARLALECAAVVGHEFWRGVVEHMSEGGAAPVDVLAAKGLVSATPSLLPEEEEEAFSFHHVLICDVAYAGITKRRRAELHERAADWLEQHGAAGDEIVGYHLEQAHRYRAELGPVDGHARWLAAEAGARLGAAGIRSWRIGDAPAATNLLGRAAALLPERHPSRPETLRELGSALWAVGEIERADMTLGEAIEAAGAARDRGMELRAQVDLAYLRMFTDPEGRAEALLDLAAQAIPVLEAIGDDRSLGRTWSALAYVHGGVHGRYAASAEACERALVHYERLGWRPATCVRELATALYYGPEAVSVATRRCRVLVAGADRSNEATLSTFLAGLEAMRGRFEAARTLAQEARTAHEQLGWSVSMRMVWAPVAADVEALSGDYDAAARLLREACEELERMEQRSALATRAAQLAAVLYLVGQFEDAGRWSDVSEKNAATDDASAQVPWRAVRGKLLAREGKFQEGEALVRDAVRLAEATDALNDRAGVLLDLAEVLRREGRDLEALRHVEQARALYEQKGNRTALRNTHALLRELAPT
jgi:DNA-binding SARP family transcriptional activator/tetratricopeptide (TPR) repeat protein